MSAPQATAAPWFERIIDEEERGVQPLFRGRAAALATIVLCYGGREVDRLESDSQGNWLWLPSQRTLRECLRSAGEEHQPLDLVAHCLDSHGNLSPPSPPVPLPPA
ncbi:hypothetical protein [Pantoea sp. 1.19]|uniref:hypothetical protein n=1 Tax=Pantoea sp. 1.19 TaxID=1925589 RepID=UPI0009488F43|nr:hypothetical protein [Pantoea sp. 1.19]